jgi:ABC-2 type transport system permease protein
MNKIKIVAKREYLKMVKSKGFWIATLMVPALMIIISLISGLSSVSLQEKLKSDASNLKTIYVLDESGYVDQNVLKQNSSIVIPSSFAAGEEAVKNGVADVFFYYPADILSSKTITIVSQDTGILSTGTYDDVAKNLLKENILSEIKDPKKIALFNTEMTVSTVLFANGVQVSSGYDRFVLPVVSVLAFFLFTTVASSYLLQSVSEEKENRMIEIVLSVIKPKDLIIGKVLGQMGAILTQLIVFIGLGVAIFKISGQVLPIDLSHVVINPWQVVLAIVYLVEGFLILSFTMVGVGAAMPSYKDANGFSSVFIMLSICPMYFTAAILANPSGIVPVILSYFPYTAPVVLLLRNALGGLPVYEMIISILVLAVAIVIVAIISYKMFEFGAMEYTEKISCRNCFRAKFKKNQLTKGN